MRYPTRHRDPIGVHREDVHENTDAHRWLPCDWVLSRLNADYFAVRRRDHQARSGRDASRRISKELQDQRSDNPKRKGPPKANLPVNE
jgi:hypothetical protein